jgi:hypothetical protein
VRLQTRLQSPSECLVRTCEYGSLSRSIRDVRGISSILVPGVQCFEVAAQSRGTPRWADPVDFAGRHDEFGKISELRGQQTNELDQASSQPHGNHGDFRWLAHHFESQLSGLSLSQVVRPPLPLLPVRPLRPYQRRRAPGLGHGSGSCCCFPGSRRSRDLFGWERARRRSDGLEALQTVG